MSADLVIGIVFPLVGGLLFAIGAFLFIRTRIFLGKAQEVQGTVVQMVWSSSSDGGGGYSPVYQFRTISGQMITVQDSLSSSPPMFQVGQIIDVLYDPENPQNARIKKFWSLYFVTILLCGMGFIFGGVGIVLLIFNLMDTLNF
jgi:hypothetical protein